MPREVVEALMVSRILRVCMPCCRYAKNRGYRTPKPGLSCPKTGVIVPQIFSALALSLIFTVVLTGHTPLCTLNKIYKIDNAPVRPTATGRLIEYLAFGIFLDTTTAAERSYAELPPYR
jgi:hypothetical protein